MTSPKPIIRTGTAADLTAFYGDNKPGTSMRALVVELDGEVVGVVGLAYHNDQMVAFSKMKEQLYKYPVTIMKTGKRFVKILEKYGRNVFAIAASYEPTSDAFLSRLGFEFIGETEAGRVYQWQTQ